MPDSFVNIPGITTWKKPVANAASLPTTGNSQGDARVTLNTSQIYIWDGSAWQLASGTTVNSFTTIQTDSGTYPVADSSTDTLTLTSTDLSVTGNSTTDTVTFDIKNDAVTFAKMQNIATNRLLGRAAAGTGDIEALATGNNLSFAGGVIGVVPSGSDTHIQFNDGGVIGGDPDLTWNKTTMLQTIINPALTTNPSPALKLVNTTSATSGNQRVSPSLILEGQGWKTAAIAGSQSSAFEAYVLPVQSSPRPFAQFNLRSVVAGSTINTPLSIQSGDSTELTTATSTFNGKMIVSHNQSNGGPTVSDHLTFANTGTNSHVKFSFSGVARGSISANSTGAMYYRSGGSSQLHEFQVGNALNSTSLVTQIYSGGIYCSYNGFFNAKVTAGSADTSARSTLNTYGSFSVKGTFVTSSTYTLSDIETMVYTDPTQAEVCTGTPTACSTYVTEGTCNAHTLVGCTWFAGNACSAFSGTDEGTCEGNTGCTWEELSCQAANNTDQATCEAQDDSYGGNCSWDTGLCPSLGADQATCEAQSGCTWNFSPCSDFNGQSQGNCEGNAGCTWTGAACSAFDGMSQAACLTGHTGCSWNGADCHAFDGTDQATCETGHTGCSWDGGTNLCNGTYDEASTCTGTYDEASTCAGQYNTSCTGNICTGMYATGNCNGVYGAACQGTALCGNIVTSGACAAESGCSWVTGLTITMPTTGTSNTGNTSRLYSIVQLTDGGTTTIVPNSGQSFLQYGSSLLLRKKGDRVTLHHHTATTPCSGYGTQVACESYVGCTWNPALVCTGYIDQGSCEAAGCNWNGSNCTGGYAAYCSGTRTIFTGWAPHNYEKSLAYVEKTANYTLTDIDDVVNVTANNVTITLPSAVNQYNKQYTIKNTGTGTVTIATTSSQTIDGLGSSVILLSQYDSLDVKSTGTNWIRI